MAVVSSFKVLQKPSSDGVQLPALAVGSNGILLRGHPRNKGIVYLQSQQTAQSYSNESVGSGRFALMPDDPPIRVYVSNLNELYVYGSKGDIISWIA